MRQNGKKGSHRRERQTVGKESGKGKSSRRGNRFQEAEMNGERQLGGLTSESVRRGDRGTVSFRETWLPVKAKRTTTKSVAASEPWAVVIKHLHHSVRDTRNPPGNQIQAVQWAEHGRTSVDITEIQQKKSPNTGCTRIVRLMRRMCERDAQHTVA